MPIPLFYALTSITNHMSAIPMSKGKYKVRNWKVYNEGLINRGRIDIWIEEEELKQWNTPLRSGERGRPKKYSDSAILMCLVVKKIYHLSLRGCRGFMISVFKLMGVSLSIPSYSQISRRSAALEVPLGYPPRKGKIDIAVDSTGLKIYGEGEWKVRKHGWTKHRRWVKLHLAIDLASEQIVLADLSPNSVDDAKGCEQMIFSDRVKTGRIRSLTGDMAYDNRRLRKKLYKAGIGQIIPPISRGVASSGEDPFMADRDQALKYIREYGREEWKKREGYHKRSLAETAMFRYKTIIGPALQARKAHTQKTEAMIGVRILNRTMQLAKPLSYKAA